MSPADILPPRAIGHVSRLAAYVLWVTAASAQSVHVVDATGAGDHVSLATATQAAQDGDVILVRSSVSFEAAGVPADRVVVVGDGMPTVRGRIGLGYQSQGWFAMRGLRIRDFAVSLEGLTPLRLESNGRFAFFEEIEIEAASGTTAMRASWSEGTTVVDSMLHGGDNYGLSSAGLGLVTFHTDTALYGSSLRGGDATQAEPANALTNRNVLGSQLLAGCHVQGGDSTVGPGALAVVASGEVLMRSTQLSTGSPAGAPVTDGPGPFIDQGEPYRALKVVQPLLREGEAGTLRYRGAAGDLVLAMASLEQDFVRQAGGSGVLHLGFPLLRTLSLGVTASGAAESSFDVRELGPGVEAVPVFVQAIVQDADGLHLSAPSMTVLLDASF